MDIMGGEAAALESLIYGLILVLIISVFANLYFLQSRLFSRVAERKLKRSLPGHIKAYLSDQADKTRNARRHQERKHLDVGVIKLRAAYLAIEAKSLDREVDSKEYWNLINTKVKKLFQILTEQQVSKPLADVLKKITVIKSEIGRSESKSDNAKAALASLDKFKTACIESADSATKLAQYNEKLDQLLTKISNVGYRKLSEKAGAHQRYYDNSYEALTRLQEKLASGEASSDELEKTNEASEEKSSARDLLANSIDRYRKNNQALKDGIAAYERDLDSVKQGIDKASSNAIITSSEGELNSANGELDDLSEQIQAANEKEIERLRGVVKDQRLTIAELETSLGEIDGDGGGGISLNMLEGGGGGPMDNAPKKSNADVGILKQSLREAEQCVAMLEDELENLKRANTASNALQDSSEGESNQAAPLTDNNVNILQATISNLEQEVSKSRQAESLHAILMNFFKESFEAQTMEDVSLFLHQTLDDLGATPSLIIYAPSREIEINAQGKMPDRNKILIKNMQVNEVNPSPKNDKVTFRFFNYGGWVEAKEGGWDKQKMNVVIDLLRSSDKILSHVKNLQSGRQQRNKMDEMANSVKKMAHEIDKALEDYAKRTQGTVEDTFGQIQDVAKARGLNATQVAGFRQIEQEALDMLASDDSLRLKTKKKFLQLVQSFEK